MFDIKSNGRITETRIIDLGAVLVAQLVERSLPIPKIRSSHLAIGNFVHHRLLRKDENKEKRGRESMFEQKRKDVIRYLV